MSASISRLTLYALISAIEQDLREEIVTFLTNTAKPSEILGAPLFKRIIERASQDMPQSELENSLDQLISFSDYGDAIQIVNAHKELVPESLAIQIRQNNAQLEHSIKVRNRVMHSRPLEFDDLAKTTDLCEKLTTNREHWRAVRDVMFRMAAEPDYLLRIEIPFETEASKISHNLPIPDFDETGFIGRSAIAKNLKKAVFGIYPVISIVGEGGLGKTSLALKIAYEIIDTTSNPFDAVIFVSAKTQKLTDNEITRIRGAINTSIGLIEAAAKSLGGTQSTTMDELVELMTEFKTLLIIDNLETVLDDKIKELMERIPTGSKVLITTRIRIGAYEFPIPLEPLNNPEATQLLRAVAKSRNCSKLVAMPDARLQGYCEKMRNNPLHIKWFVSAVQAGKRPEEVLANESIFLQFCLSNVFNAVSEEGRRLVRVMLALGGSYTIPELAYLADFEQDTLLRAIGELTRTNMFFSNSIPVNSSFETKYELSQLARAYLSRFYPIKREEQQLLLQRKQKLIGAGEQAQSEAAKNPLSASSIHCRTRSDWVIAKYLREALALTKADDFDKAFEIIESAKALAPDFSEIHRIEAFAHSKAGNITSAFDCYERAIEFSPDSAVTRLLYGGFLLRDLQDTDAAKVQFRIATDLSPGRPEPKLEHARACLFLREFDEAEAILGELDQLEILDEHLLRKITDLRLQSITRHADQLASANQPNRALEELARARAFYVTIKEPDHRMVSRVEKLRQTAKHVRSQITGDAEKCSLIGEIIAWIETTSSARPQEIEKTSVLDALSHAQSGTIRNIHQSGRFGNISTASGESVFFHVDCIKENRHLLATGRSVTFQIGTDWRGRIIADNISISS